MSGTSLDGIDVAVVELGGEDERPEPARLRAFRCFPYLARLRDRLRAAAEERVGAAALCELNFALGGRFAAVTGETLAAEGLKPAEITAIGSHGQTVQHLPLTGAGLQADSERGSGAGDAAECGSTLQIGEAAVIAEHTGIDVISDFRVRDVAAGGQGAPLAPYFDRLLFSAPDLARGIQNLGGMGNLTALPATGAGGGVAAAAGEAVAAAAAPVAFDTGPGVVLLDAAVFRLTSGARRFDEEGALAAEGEVLEDALEEWLADPFFDEPPPRSTGRERFGAGRLEAWLERHADRQPADLLATLAELTVRSVAAGVRLSGVPLDELYLCGGGARNLTLVRRIEERVSPVAVRPLEALGWDGEAREAAAFALLARQHVLELPIDVGWATGASGPRRLGKRTPA